MARTSATGTGLTMTERPENNGVEPGRICRVVTTALQCHGERGILCVDRMLDPGVKPRWDR